MAPSSRRVTGELRAFREPDLAVALDLVLRALTSQAALTEAVLETRVVRSTLPQAMQSALVEEMARELWRSGIGVTFGPSWYPARDADLLLGTGGSEDQIVDLLQNIGKWEMVSHHP